MVDVTTYFSDAGDKQCVLVAASNWNRRCTRNSNTIGNAIICSITMAILVHHIYILISGAAPTATIIQAFDSGLRQGHRVVRKYSTLSTEKATSQP